jgi:hypothetical protein
LQVPQLYPNPLVLSQWGFAMAKEEGEEGVQLEVPLEESLLVQEVE